MNDGTLKVKISVANRVYPLNIKPNQEEGLRKAAAKINQMIGQFEQSYAVQDKQDVLAMCALQLATSLAQNDLDENNVKNEVSDRLTNLNTKVSEYLKNEVL